MLVLPLCVSGFAQVATGMPPFGSFGGGPFDTVNLGNLNVHWVIPVFSKAGRGTSFYYTLSYDSSLWYPVTSNGVTSWVSLSNWGWVANSPALGGSITTTTNSHTPCIDPVTHQKYYVTGTFIKSLVDPLGTSHPFLLPEDPCDTGNIFYGTTNDGSGWSLTYNAGSITATSRLGVTTVPNVGGVGSYTDTNGNQITANSSGQFFDTLSSTTPVLTVAGSGTPSSPTTYTYTAPSGSAAYTVNYTQYTVATNFGVSGTREYGPLSTALISSIQLADGSTYQFAYEQTPGSCTPLSGTYSNYCVTARIASVMLPTGGSITYAYTGGSNGIESDGSTAGLTRTLSPGGQWQYSRMQVSGAHWQTTVTSPPDPVNSGSASDVTVIDFQKDGNTSVQSSNFYETQRQVYQGGVSPSNLLMTKTTCYNANYATCTTTAVSSPITQMDAYVQLPNGSTRLSETTYDGYGSVTDDKEYDYGVTTGSSPGNTKLVRETTISYAGLGNGIVGKPQSVTTNDWTSGTSTRIARTSYSYDQGTPTGTSGTPQHTTISGSRGNLTTYTISTSTGASISKTITYYDTGNPNVATDVNGALTTYVYGSGSCGNSFPTTINEPLNLSRYLSWNCTGGVATQVTDENGNNVTSTYTDPDFWRPASLADQMLNQTTISYSGQTAVEAALQNFNNGNSVSDSRTTVDGFGRPILSQRLQGPGAVNYDSVEADYDNFGRRYRSTMPFSASAGTTNSSAPGTTTTYDALGRILSITDSDGGQVSYTYLNNDVLKKVTGGQTFQKQFEYDGLGRLVSVCEMTQLTGSGTCGQATQVNGFWTKYTYDALGHLLTVVQNAQASSGNQQTRTLVYDMLGRVTSETNPETGHNGVSGTISYTYDSISPCGDGLNYSSAGDLVQKRDNAGNATCYSYDALHRPLTAGNKQISGATLRKFFYDSETSYPTGVTVSYGKTHMVEAQTTSTSGSVITDEFFSYDQRDELTDVYESTPHSGGYYHTTAAYWPTGTLKTLSGIPGVPTINYGANGAGLDGEGRITQVAAASGTNPVTGVTYSTTSNTNPLGALTNLTFGSTDSDSFTYDPNTGRMATYKYTVNTKTDKGTLTWNTNGTLQKLVINDQIPGTADSQTCNYTYDDLRRVASATCGSLWSQTFSYDAFGNITKSGNLSFAPGYTFGNGATTNQFYSIPGVSVSYDANGNLLTDNLNSYTWDQNWGTLLTVNNGSATVTATYDALGRMVENNAGGTWTEFVYGAIGRLAKANGQTLLKAYIALPGGAKAIYNSSGLAYYRHSDWLGSSRITSTAVTPTSASSTSAYAPFGEQYAPSGSADASFTGQDQDTVSGVFDFFARRQSYSQGRWISPDPLGRGAAALRNPQTWNRYAYVSNNPLALIDPYGFFGGICGFTEECTDDNTGGGGNDTSNDGGVGWLFGGGIYWGPGAVGVGDAGGGGGLQQAEQNALQLLQNPTCANAIDGNTGVAATVLVQALEGSDPNSPLYGSTDAIATIQPGDLGANNISSTGYSGTGGVTQGTLQPATMVDGNLVSGGVGAPWTITINSNPNGMFFAPLLNPYMPAVYSIQSLQAITVLHELGHAADYNGYPSQILNDDGNSDQSMRNSARVAAACLT
jgi:RHS repeat-associated protein